MSPETREELRRIYWALMQKPALTLADGPEKQLARLNMLTDALHHLLAKELAEYVDGPTPGDTEH